MDARAISAFTRVFRRAKRGHDEPPSSTTRRGPTARRTKFSLYSQRFSMSSNCHQTFVKAAMTARKGGSGERDRAHSALRSPNGDQL